MARCLELWVPASCGEWIEGRDAHGFFLASYPVNCFSQVKIGCPGGSCYQSKVGQLIELLKSLGLIQGPLPSINVDSYIPQSVGMGSSTADLTGVLLGLDQWFQWGLTREAAYQILCRIEPSDNMLFPAGSLVDFIQGRLIWQSPHFLPLQLLCLYNPLGEDSQAYYQTQTFPLTPDLRQKYIQAESLADLADLADQSAKIRHGYRELPYLAEIQEIGQWPGVLAYNVAHSGSLVAFIYDEHRLALDDFKAQLFESEITYYYSQSLALETVPYAYTMRWIDSL